MDRSFPWGGEEGLIRAEMLLSPRQGFLPTTAVGSPLPHCCVPPHCICARITN